MYIYGTRFVYIATAHFVSLVSAGAFKSPVSQLYTRSPNRNRLGQAFFPHHTPTTLCCTFRSRRQEGPDAHCAVLENLGLTPIDEGYIWTTREIVFSLLLGNFHGGRESSERRTHFPGCEFSIGNPGFKFLLLFRRKSRRFFGTSLIYNYIYV